MMLALVNPTDQIDRIQSDALIDPTVKTKAGWRWLPVQTDGDIAYDTETQVKSGPVYSVQSDKVLATFTVRVKTPAELDADEDARIGAISVTIFKILFNHENRIRTLAGQPQITMQQFIAAIKALT